MAIETSRQDGEELPTLPTIGGEGNEDELCSLVRWPKGYDLAYDLSREIS